MSELSYTGKASLDTLNAYESFSNVSNHIRKNASMVKATQMHSSAMITVRVPVAINYNTTVHSTLTPIHPGVPLSAAMAPLGPKHPAPLGPKHPL